LFKEARAEKARQEHEKEIEKQKAEQQLIRRRGGGLFGAFAGQISVASSPASSRATVERHITIASGLDVINESKHKSKNIRRDVPPLPKFVPRKARSMSQVLSHL
jgi:hypothetical protein